MIAIKGGPARLVPGRFARTLAEVWGLTTEQVKAEHEKIRRREIMAPILKSARGK